MPHDNSLDLTSMLQRKSLEFLHERLLGVMKGVDHMTHDVTHCCVPTGCPRRQQDPILVVTCGQSVQPVGSAVKVHCSNVHCHSGQWMHTECFMDWERRLIGWMKACGRSQGLSDVQLMQCMWTGQGHVLVRPATLCVCGKGSLCKDLGHRSGPATSSCRSNSTLDISSTGRMNVITSMRSGVSLADKCGGSCSAPHQPPPDVTTLNYPPPSFTQDLDTQIEMLNDPILKKAIEMKLYEEASIARTSSQVYRPRTFSYSSTGSSPPSSGTYSPPPSPPRDWPAVSDLTGTSPTSSSSYNSLFDWLHHQTLNNSPPPPHVPSSRLQSWSPSLRSPSDFTTHTASPLPKPSLPPIQLGNMFHHRSDLAVFRKLPRTAQNTHHIRVDDEGPHGNDQTRGFVLKNLTRARVTSVQCVACSSDLPIFDEFPLIDGTFFLSPKRYNSDVTVTFEGRTMFLNAVCLACLEGTQGGVRLECAGCHQAWSGEALLVGTMYSYDVFAAMACCPSRLGCTGCHRPVMDSPPTFFSDCSRPVRCGHCGKIDFHLTKSLGQMYNIKKIT